MVFTQEDDIFPVLLPTAETSETVDKETDATEKEEELGIFQVLERLEEVTNMFTGRWAIYIAWYKFSQIYNYASYFESSRIGDSRLRIVFF